MKLISIAETYVHLDNQHYYAYHVTPSFYIVKKIFEKGFRTPAGIDRVCFSHEPWEDMGLYIIKVVAKKDKYYSDSVESGACAHNVKPVAWGFIFNPNNIHWVNVKPQNVNLRDYDDGQGETYRNSKPTLYAHSTYERSSVLAGRPQRVFVANWETEQEVEAAIKAAKKQYPKLKCSSQLGSTTHIPVSVITAHLPGESL